MQKIQKNYISEFGLNGNHYLICQESASKKSSLHSKKNPTEANAPVVGKLKIKRDIYTVIQIRKDNRPKAKETSGHLGLLTRKELQIVHLVTQGKVNKEIADQLGISKWTVATHLRRIFVKLGVRKRTEMVCMCLQSGQSAAYHNPASML